MLGGQSVRQSFKLKNTHRAKRSHEIILCKLRFDVLVHDRTSGSNSAMMGESWSDILSQSRE
jgi:hypothetical protein